MRNGPTKGESETAIRNAVIKFEQEFMGRGPTEVKAFILRDMVLVRLKGVLKDDVIGELRGRKSQGDIMGCRGYNDRRPRHWISDSRCRE